VPEPRRRLGRRRPQTLQAPGVQAQQAAIAERRDRGGRRQGVQERHLAEDRARTELTDLLAADADGHLALGQQRDRAAALALDDQGVAGGEGGGLERVEQRRGALVAQLVGEIAEQTAEGLGIGGHRASGSAVARR